MEDNREGSWKQEYEGKETRKKEPQNFLIFPTAVP